MLRFDCCVLEKDWCPARIDWQQFSTKKPMYVLGFKAGLLRQNADTLPLVPPRLLCELGIDTRYLSALTPIGEVLLRTKKWHLLSSESWSCHLFGNDCFEKIRKRIKKSGRDRKNKKIGIGRDKHDSTETFLSVNKSPEFISFLLTRSQEHREKDK